MCFHNWSRYTSCGHTTYLNSLLCGHGVGILRTKVPATSLREAATYRTREHIPASDTQICHPEDVKLFDAIAQTDHSNLVELLRQRHKAGQPVFACHERRRDITTIVADQACPNCRSIFDGLRARAQQSSRPRKWEWTSREGSGPCAASPRPSLEETYDFEPEGVYRQTSGSSSNSEGSWWTINRLSRTHSGYRSMGTAVESILEVDEEADRLVGDAPVRRVQEDVVEGGDYEASVPLSEELTKGLSEEFVLEPPVAPIDPPLLTLTKAPADHPAEQAVPVEESLLEGAIASQPSDWESADEDDDFETNDVYGLHGQGDFKLSLASGILSQKRRVKSVSCTQVHMNSGKPAYTDVIRPISKSCVDLSSMPSFPCIPQTVEGTLGY
ncbi:hypothetical protein CFIMG_002534RA [Ceratocystis fimbriata CBS 114723]|uniref:Uncharacterized protein n=1 Tax=Ceratocystis fimbriata CBS 114723 TaxID=1035309 RepID=A0A2C5XDH4_9PEZI|nr:hypothetical protein CFIMG_002534RA [Ceratocystis fimbriata CBS 114723]